MLSTTAAKELGIPHKWIVKLYCDMDIEGDFCVDYRVEHDEEDDIVPYIKNNEAVIIVDRRWVEAVRHVERVGSRKAHRDAITQFARDYASYQEYLRSAEVS